MQQLTIAHDLPPEGEFPRDWVLENGRDRLGSWMNQLSTAERADVFAYLLSRYCPRCGAAGPQCPCGKDE